MIHKKDAGDVAQTLLKELEWEKSRHGRFIRWLIFKLGFSQCRHCIYCNVEGSKYRGIRESIILRQGSCEFSKESASSILTYEDLRKIHRCPGFIPMLYNFKDYGIDPNKIKEITSARMQYFFTWFGWIVALLIAIFKK